MVSITMEAPQDMIPWGSLKCKILIVQLGFSSLRRDAKKRALITRTMDLSIFLGNLIFPSQVIVSGLQQPSVSTRTAGLSIPV
jgi:hypothetical protein